jgi:hypothetical protein
MSALDGVCWCASDTKCPHAIGGRIPALWDSMEESIDSILKQFDRKQIKKYLKKDLKGTIGGKGKGLTDALRKVNSKSKSDNRPGTAPLNDSDGPFVPISSAPIGHFPTNVSVNTNGFASAFARPSTTDNMLSPGAGVKLRPLQSNNPHSQSLSALPTVASLEKNFVNESNAISSVNDGNNVAWGDVRSEDGFDNNKSFGHPMQSLTKVLPTQSPLFSPASIAPIDNQPAIPGDTGVVVGLMQVADTLSRLVLPWQAQCCPRACETMRDLRISYIQTKHNEFMARMTLQLEEKVLGFITRKEDEVNLWIQKEVNTWTQAMNSEESGQSEFLKSDRARMAKRIALHESTGQARELASASVLDDKERDATRDQLIKFRRLCRSDAAPGTDVRV